MSAGAREATALLRLLAWLSPAFPVGAFSYSNGLERAVHDGLVRDAATLGDWVEALLSSGSAWNDAVLAAESHRRAAEGACLAELAELAEALAGSKERHMESMLQGSAFLEAASPWPAAVPPALPAGCAYCVAFGATAGAHDIAAGSALAGFIQAFVSNQAQAAIRLSVLGQKESVALLARMEHLIEATARRAAMSTLDDLGSSAFMADIMAMRHETQHSRLFRS